MKKTRAIDPEIIVRMIGNKPYYEIRYFDLSDYKSHVGYGSYKLEFVVKWLRTCFDIVETYFGWIPVSEKLPNPETEVLILAKRKMIGSEKFYYIVSTALYEDGTIRENDSCWLWTELDGKWDEEEDCYIIPEGWWEYRHYNPDEVYNNCVDDEVIAWKPLPHYPNHTERMMNLEKIDEK